jgi:hypothetical protein
MSEPSSTPEPQSVFGIPVQGKEFLTPMEVGRMINYGRTFVYELVNQGLLLAHRHTPTGPLRIVRPSVFAFLARSAQYGHADWIKVMVVIMKRLPVETRKKALAKLTEVATR